MKIKRYTKYALLCILIAANHSCFNNNADENDNITQMKESKSFFITDVNNVKHEIFKISDKEFKKYQSEGKLIFNDSIFNKYGVSVYAFSDNRAIVHESGNYALYPSVDVLLNFLKNYSGPYKREILFNKNPYGKEFPKYADSLMNQLLADYSIDNKLDKEEIIKKLDIVVLNNRNDSFFKKYFLSLIALVGEYNIQDFKGEWLMMLADDNLTWNPYIEINNQKIYFADYIREDFFNVNLKSPITEMYESVRDIIRVNILSK